MIVETSEKHDEHDAEKNKIHHFMQRKLGSISNSNSPLQQNGHSHLNNELTLDATHSSSKLSEVNSLACLAQSITAYLITANSRKNGDQLKNLTIKLYDSVNLWLSRLFRYNINI